MADSVETALSVYATAIKTFMKIITDLDKAIAKLVQTIPEEYSSRSIPSIGPVHDADIMAEIGWYVKLWKKTSRQSPSVT
ncbi:hypothetical protein [Levilactobacillus brevis]